MSGRSFEGKRGKQLGKLQRLRQPQAENNLFSVMSYCCCCTWGMAVNPGGEGHRHTSTGSSNMGIWTPRTIRGMLWCHFWFSCLVFMRNHLRQSRSGQRHWNKRPVRSKRYIRHNSYWRNWGRFRTPFSWLNLSHGSNTQGRGEYPIELGWNGSDYQTRVTKNAGSRCLWICWPTNQEDSPWKM